jgi:hypothetical protein
MDVVMDFVIANKWWFIAIIPFAIVIMALKARG